MLVLSIISSLFSIPLIVSSGIGIGDSNNRIRWSSDEYGEDISGKIILRFIVLIYILTQQRYRVRK